MGLMEKRETKGMMRMMGKAGPMGMMSTKEMMGTMGMLGKTGMMSMMETTGRCSCQPCWLRWQPTVVLLLAMQECLVSLQGSPGLAFTQVASVLSSQNNKNRGCSLNGFFFFI